MRNNILGGWSVLVVVLLLCGGCGQEAGGRYRVSGTVTYAGKPLPSGSIGFEPDKSAGNSGAPCYASIVDGKYQTERGKGPGNGRYVVRISPPELASGSEITKDTVQFPIYETAVELPKQDSVQDFQVPDNPPASPSL